MSRTAFGALALLPLALTSAAQAQADAGQHLRPIPGPIRDAGTFHVADATWTRKSSSVSLGTDVLYNNTCHAEYFSSLSGDTYIDEGRVPGTSSPDSAVSKVGCATSYSIDGFQVAYCTDQPTASFTYAFFDSYTACSSVIGVTPVGSFALTGLPGAPSTTSFCWTLTVDTSATPFSISAGATNPLFGFSMSSPQSSQTHGPIITGDTNACSNFDGTSWDPVLNLAEDGTGMGAMNQWRIESGPTAPNCYWFGGVPFASFWLELYGTTCAPSAPGQAAFCIAGQGGTNACPCTNDPAPTAGSGCLNSFGIGAKLQGTGVASISGDTVVLTGSQMPVNAPVLYFQGNLRHNAGLGQVFGDGLRCAGGQVVRLGTATTSASGSSQYPGLLQQSVSVRGGVTAPGTRTYQGWYRNVATFCTPAGFNTTNGWEIFWGA